ncbi:hypothetical protein [Longimicrobium sp.]|uniref:hypothetical protein n=1 Tax=Longimicrobium sp. TaxID=2029185 RepID=UPI002B6C0335|nr:hypothetical protein [Longimicrobium sp.]HSU15938.1 hypothetical protein [Longimicrobium sp.]
MPLTSSEKKDYILRMIEEIRHMLAGMMGRMREGGSPDEILARAREGVGKLLGPLASVAPRMDSVTAGQMVGEPDVLGAWAEVTAAEADVHRARGDDPGANAAARRALELAVEAHLRTPADRADFLALVARLRPQVDAAALVTRHRDALGAIPVD